MSFDAGILQELLSTNHGWWCHALFDEPAADGTCRTHVTGKPYLDPSLYRLYGYETHPQDFSFRSNIHPEDRKRIAKALKESIRPGATARSERVSIKTAGGNYKLVQVYFRRLEMDGHPMLASMHS